MSIFADNITVNGHITNEEMEKDMDFLKFILN